jgi:hypothetical protein
MPSLEALAIPLALLASLAVGAIGAALRTRRPDEHLLGLPLALAAIGLLLATSALALWLCAPEWPALPGLPLP